MNESEALLVVERGPVTSLRFALQQEQVTIGRSAGNELVLADPEVSRRHSRVVRRADGYAVEDIGSTNGTFVNGQRISHLTLLQDGDTIDLGDTVRLRFIWQTAVPAAPAAPPLPRSEQPTETLDAANVPVWPEAPRPQPAPAYSPPPAYAPPAYAPPPEAPAARPAPSPLPPAPAGAATYPPPIYPTQPRRGRGLLIGCGLLVALLLVCAGTFLILDSVGQGEMLYCGVARPVVETVLDFLGLASRCPATPVAPL